MFQIYEFLLNKNQHLKMIILIVVSFLFYENMSFTFSKNDLSLLSGLGLK